MFKCRASGLKLGRLVNAGALARLVIGAKELSWDQCKFAV